MGENIMK